MNVHKVCTESTKAIKIQPSQDRWKSMDSGPTFIFYHKINAFTPVQICQYNLKGFLLLNIKEVDNTSKTWPSVTFWKTKDEEPTSVDSKIVRKTKDR